jgi:hypothetical protein
MANRLAIDAKVNTENNGLTRGDRNKASKRSQERRLSCAIRSAQENDSATIDIKIDTGKGRESAEKGHRPAEVDHGLCPGPGSGVVGLHGVP